MSVLRCVDCGLDRETMGCLHTAADCRDALRRRVTTLTAERDEARGLLRDVDTAWSDCLLTEDQADVLERIARHLEGK